MRISREELEKYWQMYQRGLSLRQISKTCNIHNQRLSEYFTKTYKEAYKAIASKKRTTTLLEIIQNEYLNNKYISKKDKEVIKAWLTNDKLIEIVSSEASKDIRLISAKGEESFSNRLKTEQTYTGRADLDFRNIIDNVDLSYEDAIPYMSPASKNQKVIYDY